MTLDISELNGLVWAIHSLKENAGWIYITQLLNTTKEKIIEQILTSNTDQSLNFNADHIFKSRLEVINTIINLPNQSIKELDNQIFAFTQNAKSTKERLDEYWEKFIDKAMTKGLI